MKKNAKYGLIIVTIIILAVVISLVYLKNNPSNNVEPVVSEEPVTLNVTEQPVEPAPVATSSVVLTPEKAVEQAQELAVDAPVVVSIPVPVVATNTPVYTKTIKVEYMNDAEKTKLGIPTVLKAQVLGRNSEGTVLGYKIIRQDSDIVTKFGN